MKLHWAFLERSAIIVTLITAAASVLWFAFDLASRVSKLEAKMQTIATAPTTGKLSDGAVRQNPIQQACAELVRKASEESHVSRSYTVDLMDKLGCRHQNSN